MWDVRGQAGHHPVQARGNGTGPSLPTAPPRPPAVRVGWPQATVPHGVGVVLLLRVLRRPLRALVRLRRAAVGRQLALQHPAVVRVAGRRGRRAARLLLLLLLLLLQGLVPNPVPTRAALARHVAHVNVWVSGRPCPRGVQPQPCTGAAGPPRQRLLRRTPTAAAAAVLARRC